MRKDRGPFFFFRLIVFRIEIFDVLRVLTEEVPIFLDSSNNIVVI